MTGPTTHYSNFPEVKILGDDKSSENPEEVDCIICQDYLRKNSETPGKSS